MQLCTVFAVGALSVLAVGVIIAYINVPIFPDTARNRGLKMGFGLGFRFISFMDDLACKLGFPRAKMMQNMLGAMKVTTKQPADLLQYKTVIEGVEVLITKPARFNNGELLPGIMHFHGGGWVLLDPDGYAPVINEIVRQTQAVVVSVNYRKAPDHLFPAAIEDCLKVTRYFLKNAEEYGVDKHRVGIKGDSAGGNLAMAATIALTKEADPDLPKIKFMSLDYPALQAFDFNLPCYIQYETGPGFLNKKVMIEYWLLYAFGNLDYFDLFAKNAHLSKDVRQSKHALKVSSNYLPDRYRKVLTGRDFPLHEAPSDVTRKIEQIVLNPLFAPLMTSDEDLAKLPTTYIFNAEFDALRDDGFIVAERLRSVGVEVEHSYLPAEEHGVFNLIEIDPEIRKEFQSFGKFFNKTLDLSNSDKT